MLQACCAEVGSTKKQSCDTLSSATQTTLNVDRGVNLSQQSFQPV